MSEELPVCKLCKKEPQNLHGDFIICPNKGCGMYDTLLERHEWIKLNRDDKEFSFTKEELEKIFAPVDEKKLEPYRTKPTHIDQSLIRGKQ